MDLIEEPTRASVRMFLAAVNARYDVVEAILFGSRARGDHTPDSDADLAVVLGGYRRGNEAVLLDLSDAAYDVLLETGVNISPLPIAASEWTSPSMHSNPELLANIARDGVRF